jgi:hypothetical protein
MKAAWVSWGVIVALALALKLFTFEYFLADDPTSGIAVRPAPSLQSRQMLQHSPPYGRIITETENDFLGASAYRFMTTWGWLAVVLIGPALYVIARRSPRRSAGG